MIVACPCPEENVFTHGIIEIDSEGKVTSFLEKPKPTETSSRLQSPCFYILDTKCQGILDEFLEASKDLPLEKKVLFCRIFQQLKKEPIFIPLTMSPLLIVFNLLTERSKLYIPSTMNI